MALLFSISGDWESAIGAAAHMGRKDIAEFLMSHGARPDHFTFAMLGELDALKAMIVARPGLQKVPDPHGIPLLQHAKHRLWHRGITTEDKAKVDKTVAYLASLGDADETAKNLEITEVEKEMYVGEYRFGEKSEETMKKKHILSKTDYIQYLDCPEELWLRKNKSEILPPINLNRQSKLDQGNLIDKLAQDWFSDGCVIADWAIDPKDVVFQMKVQDGAMLAITILPIPSSNQVTPHFLINCRFRHSNLRGNRVY